MTVSEGNKKEKEWPQILAILTGSLTVVTSGFLYAWPSPFIVKIVQDKEHYNINEEEASYFAIANTVGMALAPFFVSLINMFGRKRSMLLTAVPYILSLVIKAFATNVWIFYFARFIYGIGDAINYTCTTIYVGEIASPKVRGIWGNSLACAAYSGYFLVNLLGGYLSVRETSIVALSIPILFLFLFSLMPESPYFYVMKNNLTAATESLKRLRRKTYVDCELKEIQMAVERQMAESRRWKDLFTIKSNRNALRACFFLRIGQHLSGFYAFSSYTQFIFKKSGSDVSAQTSSLIYTAVIVVTLTSTSYICEKLGRRKSYISSLLAASLVLLIEGLYFYADQTYPRLNMDFLQWVPLAGMITFVIAASFGISSVPIVMTTELFSASIKEQAVGFITLIHALGGFAVNMIFYYLNSSFGLYAPFFFFAVCNIASAILSYFILPETKGKTLEEIQLALKEM